MSQMSRELSGPLKGSRQAPGKGFTFFLKRPKGSVPKKRATTEYVRVLALP